MIIITLPSLKHENLLQREHPRNMIEWNRDLAHAWPVHILLEEAGVERVDVERPFHRQSQRDDTADATVELVWQGYEDPVRAWFRHPVDLTHDPIWKKGVFKHVVAHDNIKRCIGKRESLGILMYQIHPRHDFFGALYEDAGEVEADMVFPLSDDLEKKTTPTPYIEDPCVPHVMASLHVFGDHRYFLPRKVRDERIVILVVIQEETCFEIFQSLTESVMVEE